MDLKSRYHGTNQRMDYTPVDTPTTVLAPVLPVIRVNTAVPVIQGQHIPSTGRISKAQILLLLLYLPVCWIICGAIFTPPAPPIYRETIISVCEWIAANITDKVLYEFAARAIDDWFQLFVHLFDYTTSDSIDENANMCIVTRELEFGFLKPYSCNYCPINTGTCNLYYNYTV